MICKFQLHKLTTLLIMIGIVFSSFTNTFAQSESIASEPDGNLSTDSANFHLFLPIVQSNSDAEISAASSGSSLPPPPSGCPSYSVVGFSGYRWVSMDEIQDGSLKYSCKNYYVDANGNLHLKLYATSAGWYCANLMSNEQTFGFGQYEWQIYGQLEQLDPNVQLRIGTSSHGIATHYTPGIGAVFTHGGVASNPVGNYFVNQSGSRQGRGFNVPATRTGLTSYRYTWTPQSVQFQSLANETNTEFANWTFAPSSPQSYIPQQPMGVSMDLCFFSNQAQFLQASGASSIEVLIHQFKYTPSGN